MPYWFKEILFTAFYILSFSGRQDKSLSRTNLRWAIKLKSAGWQSVLPIFFGSFLKSLNRGAHCPTEVKVIDGENSANAPHLKKKRDVVFSGIKCQMSFSAPVRIFISLKRRNQSADHCQRSKRALVGAGFKRRDCPQQQRFAQSDQICRLSSIIEPTLPPSAPTHEENSSWRSVLLSSRVQTSAPRLLWKLWARWRRFCFVFFQTKPAEM